MATLLSMPRHARSVDASNSKSTCCGADDLSWIGVGDGAMRMRYYSQCRVAYAALKHGSARGHIAALIRFYGLAVEVM